MRISESRTFIPLEAISTVVINEGLTRWSIRYYLAIIKRGGAGLVDTFDVSYFQVHGANLGHSAEELSGGETWTCRVEGDLSWVEGISIRRI